MNVNNEVKNVLKDFHKQKKHIGLSNASSILAVRAFNDSKILPEFYITLGKKGEQFSE